MSAGQADTNVARSGVPRVNFNRLRRFLAFFSKPLKFIVAVLFALTPITAIIVMGWLARLSELKSVKFLATQTSPDLSSAAGIEHSLSSFSSKWPSWFTAEMPLLPEAASTSRWAQFLGGLWTNIILGLKSVFALAIATLPFGVLWLLGWWSGWQNSFTKGYENAFAGPTISLIAVALACITLSYLPMALAHFSMERRLAAFFEMRRVVKLICAAGWRYLLLALFYVIAALAIFMATVTPVFIEQIRPDILTMTPEKIEEFRGAFHFWTSVYCLAALIFLRAMGGRIYTRCLIRLNAIEPREWNKTRLMQIAAQYEILPGAKQKSPPGKINAVFMAIILAVIWFGLVAQIYVAQFMNYKWWSWLNHPLIQIPWFPPLGPWG